MERQLARRRARMQDTQRKSRYLLASRLRKAVRIARRHGILGCLHLVHVTVVEPFLMKPFPLYVQARRHVVEHRRRRIAEARLAHWRTRRDQLIAVTRLVATPTESIADPALLDRLRTRTGSRADIVLADIDQDGFLCSRAGRLRDVPTVSRDEFIPRTRFDLTVIDIDGVLGVKKHFKGDVPTFVAELEAAYDLFRAGCRVPAILDVDFSELAITFEFVPGRVLREELARQGAILRDRDVTILSAHRPWARRRQRATRIEDGRAVLHRVMDAKAVERVSEELTKVHAAGYVLHDVKFGNIILEGSSGAPYLIDFDRVRAYPNLSPLAFRFLRDRDSDKFNAHFGTRRMTFRKARQWTKQGPLRTGPLYSPMYLEGGLRFGGIWSTDVGYGRWRYILRDNLPILRGARVLDLGANNGFNAIQMMRSGAGEVVAVENDGGAVAQGQLVRELFEWADNRPYPLRYVCDSMAELAQLDLGTFDLVTALCSIYYLDDSEINAVVDHVSTIADTLVLQCNTDRRIRRSDVRTYEKASVEYATGVLHRNGFLFTQVTAPRGYSRPLVIGRRQQ